MSTRQLLAAVFALSFAVVAASPSAEAGCTPGNIPCEVGSATGTLAASSGGCFPPSVAVDLYFEAASGFAMDGGGNSEDDCEKICDKFEDTCDEIAKIAKSCQNRGGGEFAELERATCATLEAPADRNACKREVNAFRDFVRDCTNADRVHAADCCANNRALCEQICDDDASAEVDFQACFTGPGGYAGGSCFFTLVNTPF